MPKPRKLVGQAALKLTQVDSIQPANTAVLSPATATKLANLPQVFKLNI